MAHLIVTLGLVAFSALPLLSIEARPQQANTPAEVQKRIAHRAGTWTIEMDLYDEHGKVARTVTGTDTATRFGSGHVLDIETVFPALGDRSKAWMFFDPADGRFKNVSVDEKGNYWLLSGGLDQFVLSTAPRPTTDGGQMVMRFTHRDITPDTFVASGEISFDGGSTFRPMSTQRFTRVDRRR